MADYVSEISQSLSNKQARKNLLLILINTSIPAEHITKSIEIVYGSKKFYWQC